MSSNSESPRDMHVRRYVRANSVVFLKTREEFGGLSNMAGGFPLMVNGVHILSAEALYQVCRFPHRPDVQRLIIEQRSPMTAKMVSKPYRRDSRQDWNRVKIAIMRWCLRVKLAQNWTSFSELLIKTDDRPIVEESHKDDYWGARSEDEFTLVGMNMLGRLLMELRGEVMKRGRTSFEKVEPPHVRDLLLYGQPISVIQHDAHGENDDPTERIDRNCMIQVSLFSEKRLKHR